MSRCCASRTYVLHLDESKQTLTKVFIDYKKKYKSLKRKLYCLVYEQEAFVEELQKSQRKLLRLHRERSFLLDRLLQYEKLDEASDDSDATDITDEIGSNSTARSQNRKKLPKIRSIGSQRSLIGKSSASLPTAIFKSASSISGGSRSSISGGSRSKVIASLKRSRPTRTAKPASTKRPKGSANVITESVNRADLERRLDFRHSDMQIMTMSHSLPEDIFNDSTCDSTLHKDDMDLMGNLS